MATRTTPLRAIDGACVAGESRYDRACTLEERVSQVCGGVNQLYAQLVDVMAEALAEDTWVGDGIRSPEHWLVLHAGLSPARARQVALLARRHDQLPTTLQELRIGQLSVDQAVTIAKHAPSSAEASVVELALNATVPQLSRSVSKYDFDPDEPTTPATGQVPQGDDDTAADDQPSEDGSREDEGGPASEDQSTQPSLAPVPEPSSTASARAAEPATLSMRYEDGRFTLFYSAPADLGALVEAAIREAKDALFHDGNCDATLADGLAEVAARSLGAVDSVHRRDAFRVYVHLDSEGGWLTGKPRLPRHIVEKLTCDGVLQPVWHTEGAPVNVGRAQRIVPDRTRRLIEDRDRGCCFPGCAATSHVEIHHLIHWKDGGRTNTDELLSLCDHHHDRHHAGDFSISGNPDQPGGLTFTDSAGRTIRPGPRYSPPDAPPPTTAYAGPTGERLNLKLVQFTHRPPPPVPA